jgi:hypothetical protein
LATLRQWGVCRLVDAERPDRVQLDRARMFVAPAWALAVPWDGCDPQRGSSAARGRQEAPLRGALSRGPDGLL